MLTGDLKLTMLSCTSHVADRKNDSLFDESKNNPSLAGVQYGPYLSHIHSSRPGF